MKPARHPLQTPKQPQGQPTRGKTAPNRLRKTDLLWLLYEPSLLTRSDGNFANAWWVDLGYGAEATTTLESAARLRSIAPNLPILGVEIEPQRVQAALPFANHNTQFRLGGFNLPLQTGEHVRAIRAMNVLRQYPEEAVLEAWQWMSRSLLPGGLLLEGTSTPTGRLWCANLLRQTTSGLHLEALIFGTNFHTPFAPEMFQPILPKNLIHRMLPGEGVYAFFEDWKRAARETASSRSLGERFWFTAALRALQDFGYPLVLRRRWVARGLIVLRTPQWAYPRR